MLVASEQTLPAGPIALVDDLLVQGDSADVLPRLPAGGFDLIYIDPPFNTGRRQTRRTLATEHDPDGGDRIGFGGRRYRSSVLSSLSYRDDFDDYLGFLEPHLRQARRLLAAHGTLYLHVDYREAHYCKLMLDEVFGRECFLNEIIWAYDYGAKPRRRWPAKHDTILVYVRIAGQHWFDADAVEREPYMAPGLVGAEKASSGQDAHRRLLAHHRSHPRPREDRLSDPEARGAGATPGQRLVAARGLVPGLLCRFGNARRGLRRAGTPFRAGRLQPRSGGDCRPPAGGAGGHGCWPGRRRLARDGDLDPLGPARRVAAHHQLICAGCQLLTGHAKVPVDAHRTLRTAPEPDVADLCVVVARLTANAEIQRRRTLEGRRDTRLLGGERRRPRSP